MNKAWGFRLGVAALLSACSVPGLGAAPAAEAPLDLSKAELTSRRVLEWGTRPIWSPDSRKIAFVEADKRDSFAFELDLDTMKVRCVTCHLGMEGRVTRIYYAPDGNYIFLARRGLGRGTPPSGVSTRSNGFTQELYWMSSRAGSTLQPLDAPAFGDMAIERGGAVPGRIAWGEVTDANSALNVGVIKVVDGEATLTERRRIYDSDKNGKPLGVTMSEAYDFTSDGKGVTFYTIAIEPNTLNGEMYVADIATGKLSRLYSEPAHNETHLFPGDRFGLEESNRASDPNGKWRGISAHRDSFRYLFRNYRGMPLPTDQEVKAYERPDGSTGFDRAFDLYLITMDGSAPPRRLSSTSETGANSNQSAIAPDGRHIVYAVDARGTTPFAAQEGIYIGEFRAK